MRDLPEQVPAKKPLQNKIDEAILETERYGDAIVDMVSTRPFERMFYSGIIKSLKLLREQQAEHERRLNHIQGNK